MKKTAKQILAKYFPTNEYICLPIPEAELPKFLDAMEEYAKQENQPNGQISAERLDSANSSSAADTGRCELCGGDGGGGEVEYHEQNCPSLR
jgi:hypothetical protein